MATPKKVATPKVPKKRGTRKGKTDRVPKTRAGGEWTEAAFWGFIRSNIRRTSRNWPPLARLALQEARRPYQGENKRQKWEFQCADCTNWFKRTEVEVDHKVPCGQLKSFADLATFYERTFCETDGLRVLCEGCHLIRTNKSKEEDA
jgi:5-methylcytosine-specific restriction endonuclease McrA